MIVYDLQCANGHCFEGWFKDRKAFLEQKRKQLIICPTCNDTSVEALPSKVSIKAGVQRPAGEDGGPRKLPTVEKTLKFLENNFENVGSNFAQEALKMHYDVSEKRNIRGTSTEAEEEMLKKEDIKFFKIPIPRLDS